MVCLFIAEKQIEDILFKDKAEFKSATSTARLRLKFLLYLKSQLTHQSKGITATFNDMYSQKALQPEIHNSPDQVMDTEDDGLLKDAPESTGQELFETPIKKPLLSMKNIQPPSLGEVLSANQDNLHKKLTSMNQQTIKRMKSAMGKVNDQDTDTSTRKKKTAMIEIISKVDMEQDIDISEDSEDEVVKDETEQNFHDSDRGSEMDDSCEMDDPIASMTFMDLHPSPHQGIQMVKVRFHSNTRLNIHI